MPRTFSEYIHPRRLRRRFAKKKDRATTRKFTTGLYMLRCKELGLTLDELEQMEYGLVLDMMIEKSNDEYKYPYKATQKDFNKF